MIKLAESSGTVIYEEGSKLYLVKKPAQWTTVFLFVSGLLGFILLINGFLQLVVFKIEPFPKLAIILLAIGGFFTLLFWRVMVYRKKVNAKPVHELQYICIIDLASNDLLDAQQHVLAPLHIVHLHRKMQITSSSPSLVLKWDKNTLTLVEGNPFSGGIAAVENVLIAKGLKRN